MIPRAAAALVLVLAAGAQAQEPGPGFWALLRQARAGDPAAQARLGRAFHRGDGVTRDLAEAARWYRAAAVRGDPEGAYGLALLYAGDPADEAVFRDPAHRLSRDTEALYGFDTPQPAAIGTGPDPVEAARWFRRAAERGHGKSQYRLGLAYLEGKGLPRDPEEAAFWLGLAARSLEGPEREAAEKAFREAAARLTPYRRDVLRGRIREWSPRR